MQPGSWKKMPMESYCRCTSTVMPKNVSPTVVGQTLHALGKLYCSVGMAEMVDWQKCVYYSNKFETNERDSTLQDCFGHVDWNMFRIASNNNIDEYDDSVSEFIRKCVDDVVPIATIKTFPNQKL